ncbi:MAG: type II and III secretion system protein family protein, partial [Gemmatimonadota bacterium]
PPLSALERNLSMTWGIPKTLRRVTLLAALTLVPLGAAAAAAQEPAESGSQQTLNLTTGKSTILAFPQGLNRVSVGNPEVLDAVVVSPREVLVNGKTAGVTSLILSGGGTNRIYDVVVSNDVSLLQQRLEAMFPGEPIRVTMDRDLVVLQGRVNDPYVASRALQMARLYAGGDSTRVINSFEFQDTRQVLLQVRIAEVNRQELLEWGIKGTRIDPNCIRCDTEGHVGYGNPGGTGGNFINNPAGPDQFFSDALNLYFFDPGANVGVFVRALKEKGLLQTLAEPNLVAANGQEASFLVGGEFPYPVVQPSSNGLTVTIVFKEFGIRLRFRPTMVGDGLINLDVEPEVSQLDFANGLTFSGFVIPALSTRKAKTSVQLRDGQTFSIAGLISHETAEVVSKLPVLGDIPTLGYLFKSKNFRERETELVVLVTPSIVSSDAPVPDLPEFKEQFRKQLEGFEGPRGHSDGQ